MNLALAVVLLSGNLVAQQLVVATVPAPCNDGDIITYDATATVGTPGPFQGATAATGAVSPTGSQSAEFVIIAKASSAITRTITWADGNCTNQPTVSALFYAEALN